MTAFLLIGASKINFPIMYNTGMKLTSDSSAQAILGLAQGFMESRILLSAAELNVFPCEIRA